MAALAAVAALAAMGIGLSLLLYPAWVGAKHAPPKEFAVAPLVNEHDWRNYLDDRTGRLVGRVVGPDGAPAAGARVWLAANIADHPLVEVRADQEGRFELDVGDSAKLYAQSADGQLESSSRYPFSIGHNRSQDVGKPIIELKLAERQRRWVEVQVVDGNGEPVAGTQLVLHQHGWLNETGVTDHQGRARATIRRDSECWEVLAFKSGWGVDSIEFGVKETMRAEFPIIRVPQPKIEAQFDEWLSKQHQPLTLRLLETAPVTVQAVDQRNRPVRDLLISALVHIPKPFSNFFIHSAGSRPLPELSRLTDDEGRATFDMLPVEGSAKFDVAWGGRDDTRARFYTLAPLEWSAKSGRQVLTLRVARTAPIRGKVTEADGRPVAEATLTATSYGASGTAVSRPNGSYELFVRPDHTYTMTASTRLGESLPREGVRVAFETPVDGIDLALQPRAEVTVSGSEPVTDPGQSVGRRECTVVQCDSLPLRAFDGKGGDAAWNLARMHTTSFGMSILPDGRLRANLGPGAYIFFGRPWQTPHSFRITDRQPLAITMRDPPNWPGESLLTGVVFDQLGKPVAGADVYFYSMARPSTGTIWHRADAEGRFSFWRPRVDGIVKARLGRGDAVARIDADTKELELRHRGFARIRGKFVGLPPLKRSVRWEARLTLPVDDTEEYPAPVVERSPLQEGEEFVFRCSCVGLNLNLQISDTGRVWHTVATLKAETEGELDAGEITVDADQLEAALTDPMALAFAGADIDDEPFARGSGLSGAIDAANRTNRKLLIVAADPNGPLCRDLAQWLREGRAVTDGFRLLALRVSQPFGIDAHSFVPWLDVSFADAEQMVLAIVSPQGILLQRWRPGEFSHNGRIDRAKVQGLLTKHRN
jgi:protocatechuate 3,4-dioxygenase beta subunit